MYKGLPPLRNLCSKNPILTDRVAPLRMGCTPPETVIKSMMVSKPRTWRNPPWRTNPKINQIWDLFFIKVGSSSSGFLVWKQTNKETWGFLSIKGFPLFLFPCTTLSVEDETRNAKLNGIRNPEWWGDFMQLQIQIEQKSQFEFVPQDTSEFKSNQNLNWTLHREIPRNLIFSILTSWLKSPHHSGFRIPFNPAFRVSSSTERAVLGPTTAKYANLHASGPFLRSARSATDSDFQRPVRSVKRSRFAARVFARSKPVNWVRILPKMFMFLTRKQKLMFYIYCFVHTYWFLHVSNHVCSWSSLTKYVEHAAARSGSWFK